MSTSDDEENSYEKEETQILNAEEVTLIATSFLRRLGNKRGLKPFKVSLQEGKYVVEVGIKDKNARIWVDAINEEIKGYEIKEKGEEATPFFPITRKNIFLICGIVAISIIVSSLLGVQSLIPSIF